MIDEGSTSSDEFLGGKEQPVYMRQDDFQNERMVEKLLEKAVASTGDGPIPPLARAQLEHVRELVGSRLHLATVTPLATSIYYIVESERALNDLLTDLPNLCGYPSDCVPTWTDPLIKACRGLQPVLPKMQYKGTGGRTRISTCSQQQLKHAPVAPFAAKRRQSSVDHRLVRRIARKKSSTYAGASVMETDAHLAIGLLGKDAYHRTMHKGVAVQTDAELLTDYQESERCSLLEKVLQAEATAKNHQKTVTKLEASLSVARTNLAAKARAVSDLRIGLYKEICLLREQCHILKDPTEGHKAKDLSSILSIIDQSIGGLEEPDPTEVGKGHPVHRMIAAEGEIKKLKEKHAMEKQLWAKEAMKLHMRFRAMVAEKQNALDEKKNVLTEEDVYTLQDAVDVVKGEFNTFSNAIERHIGNFRDCLSMFTDEFTRLYSAVEQQQPIVLKGTALCHLFSAASFLITPVLNPEFKWSGQEHPWSYTKHQEPLYMYVKEHAGYEGAQMVVSNIKTFQKIYTKTCGIVLEKGLLPEPCEEGVVIGQKLKERVERLLTYELPDEDAEKLRRMLSEDLKLSREIAGTNFKRVSYRYTIKRHVAHLQDNPDALVQVILRMQLRQADRRLTESLSVVRSLRRTRNANCDVHYLNTMQERAKGLAVKSPET